MELSGTSVVSSWTVVTSVAMKVVSSSCAVVSWTVRRVVVSSANVVMSGSSVVVVVVAVGHLCCHEVPLKGQSLFNTLPGSVGLGVVDVVVVAVVVLSCGFSICSSSCPVSKIK